MSRHRKIRSLCYEDELDDYYQDGFDDDDDFDDVTTHVLTSNQPKRNVPKAIQNKIPIQNKQTSSSNQASTSHIKGRKRSTSRKVGISTQLENKQSQINFDEQLKEYEQFAKSVKQRTNLIVVGHVDAGKSTLVGRMLCDLGLLTQKQMHRNEVDSQRTGKASFKYAWALDETNTERERGVTIDLALTRFETKNRVVVVLDSPGHVDFVPAVISGAAQADAALLVIDATKGKFEAGFDRGGQTREHAFLVRSLGVSTIIVVVNKMDLTGWDWDRYSEIKTKLVPFLKHVGYDTEKDVKFVPCSGLKGENLIVRKTFNENNASSHPQLESDQSIWKGIVSLLEIIDNIPVPVRLVDRPARIIVSDIYKGNTAGVTISGNVSSGKVLSNQKMLLLPPNEILLVKSIESKDNTIVGRAFARDIVTLVVAGIDANKYFRGCVMCDPSAPCTVTNRFQARLIMFQNADVVLLKGTPIEVHVNGANESGQIRRLVSLIDITSGEVIRFKPKCITRNSASIVQLRLSRPVCLELYSVNKDLGRFMIRSAGKTIAAGVVTKLKACKVVDLNKMKSK